MFEHPLHDGRGDREIARKTMLNGKGFGHQQLGQRANACIAYSRAIGRHSEAAELPTV
jgi:hypothetical protein